MNWLGETERERNPSAWFLLWRFDLEFLSNQGRAGFGPASPWFDESSKAHGISNIIHNILLPSDV